MGSGADTKPSDRRMQELKNMLEDVVNELDLSGSMLEKHGPLGTSPAELVKLVLDQKDLEIRMLKNKFVAINAIRRNNTGSGADTKPEEKSESLFDLKTSLLQAETRIKILQEELKLGTEQHDKLFDYWNDKHPAEMGNYVNSLTAGNPE